METHATTVRIPEELYQRLRKAAFEQVTYINDLVCQGIELRLAQLKDSPESEDQR